MKRRLYTGHTGSGIMPVTMTQRRMFYFSLLSILADAATFATIRIVSPSFITRFSTPGGWNALIVAITFILFAFGVFLFRRLKASPTGSTEWLPRGSRIALALTFAVVISLALAWQLGFFSSSSQVDTTEMGEGGTASYFVFGPGSWLAFSLVYVLVFAFRVEPAIVAESPGYWIASLFGLLTTATMLILFVVQAKVIMPSLGPFIGAVITFVTLGLLFLPPRLEYLSRTIGLRSRPSYAAIAAFTLLLASLACQVATI